MQTTMQTPVPASTIQALPAPKTLMGKAIGLHFFKELQAAGLSSLALSWTADTVNYPDGLAQADEDALIALYAAHDAAPRVADIRAAAIAQVRLLRAPIINVLDGMQSSANTANDQPKAQAIQAAKQGLKDLPQIDLSACTSADDCKRVVMTRYKEIAAALPADVRTAFSESRV